MFAAFRRSPPKAGIPPLNPMFEVRLVDCSPVGMPLTIFTNDPLQVADELMLGRDPGRWDVTIRALAAGERPV